jgi:asparagine synthase (glutamine-hydrolysing)
MHLDETTGTAIGATRLSIIDVQGGHQPVTNEVGSIAAVLNGEIYNYPALADRLRARGHTLRARVDTEALVHLYEDYGVDLVHALDGMYAFAIWDASRRRLVLARDRFGEKPLFYEVRNGVLTFASELCALIAGTGATPALDAAQLDAYFVLGYVPGPGTLLEGVRQVPPGHVLVWEDGRETVRQYWRPPVLTEGLASEGEDLVVETERLLADAVRSRLMADVPLGVFLSGGLDSTLVASFAAEASPRALETFTVGYDVGGVNETDPARIAAEAIGSDHHELLLGTADVEPLARSLFSRLDQPIADQALLASHAVSKFARERVKVVVGGEGADELFGGYPRYRWLTLAQRLDDRVPDPLARAFAGSLRRLPISGRAGRLSQVIDPDTAAARHLDWVTSDRQDARSWLYGPALQPSFSAESLESLLPHTALEGADTGRAFMALDQVLWLPDDVLAKADRASMLASLEVRTPFLEPTLAEFASAVPARIHMQDGGKSLLRAVLRRRLPSMRRGRQKTAFRVPADQWLRGPLAPLVRDQVESSRLYEDGWIDRDAARRMVAEHAGGEQNRTEMLWPLMVLAFWVDRVAGGSAV